MPTAPKKTDLKTTDSRRARSNATKQAMMRAAEKLIAQVGVENTSIREIVAEAGQKNESAIQYHFKNLSGLLEAIHTERSEQIQQYRAKALAEVLQSTNQPDLRQLCTLMVAPTFELARANADFRRYIKAFGHELALSEASPLKIVTTKGGGGESGLQVSSFLRKTLGHLDSSIFQQRMEAVVMLCSVAMSRQARQKNAFRGQQSEMFFHNLVDAMVGLLGAPVSPETQAASQE